MHYRTAGALLALLALAACSHERPTQAEAPVSDLHAIYSHVTFRQLGTAHNFALRELGPIVARKVDRRAPLSVQFSTLKAVLIDYLATVGARKYASADVEHALNAEIWREGSRGRFWAFRTGAHAVGPLTAPRELVPGDPLSPEGQAYEAQVLQIAGDSTVDVYTSMSALDAVQQSAAQTLSPQEASAIAGFVSLADSSMMYWQAQMDSSVAGQNPLYGPYFLAAQEAPPSRPFGAPRATLSLWSRLRNAVLGDAWGSIVGAWACVQSLVCDTPWTWELVAPSAFWGGVLGSLGGALMT